MPEPRIWFDPPAFSWGRVLRIGALWFALVLVALAPVLVTVEEERSTSRPAPPLEPAGLIAEQPPSLLRSAPTSASVPRTAVAARVASAPTLVASAAR